MINLSNSGLPIQLEIKGGTLYFDTSVISTKPAIRTINEAFPYYEPNFIPNKDIPLYYMYRDVKRKIDEEMIQKSLYRYDLTVILPGKIGEEAFKTIGHVHPLSKQSILPYTYTEVYSVIFGTAQYVLQKFSPDFSSISDVVVLTVHEGEHVLIPSFYGHVTVNVTNKPLVMANILFKDFSSFYEPYYKNHGAAIYLKLNDNNKISISLNPSYKTKLLPRKVSIKDFPPPSLKQNYPLYQQWVNHLEDFSYLYKPT